MNELEEQAIEAAVKYRQPPPNLLETASPFYMGSPVWAKSTGVKLGEIKARSHAHWAKVHWALVSGPGCLVVLSFELGDKYTLFNPNGLTPRRTPDPVFHIGMRLYNRVGLRKEEPPEYVGIVTNVFRNHSDHEWVGRTATGVMNFTWELDRGSVTIGQRQHRSAASSLPRLVT